VDEGEESAHTEDSDLSPHSDTRLSRKMREAPAQPAGNKKGNPKDTKENAIG